MKGSLKYGKSKIDLNFPDKAELLHSSEPVFNINKIAFKLNLESYLPNNASSYSDVAVVVSDKTRLCSYPEYLPWLVEILESKGARSSNITFYIAYGTHPKQSEEESLTSYGKVYEKYKFIHHDCYDVSALKFLGKTSRGTNVKVRKDVLESSLIITFGAISHHYFAGFGGGRKLFFPGLADRKEIYRNHSYFLDLETKRLSEGCQPGKLEGNPIAEDLKEIDSLMPSKISIHGILNSTGKVCQLLIGNSYEDFLIACETHDSYYRSTVKKQYDLVVASSGGYPKDINFIQGHKSIHNSAAFVKDGGKLVVLCECIDGIGSNYFMKFIETGNFDKTFAVLKENYEGNGGTALSMMTKTKRIKIDMVTNLSEEECNSLQVNPLKPENIQKIIDEEPGSIAVIENASLLIK